MTATSPAYLWYPADIDSSGRVRSLTDLEELWYRRALDQSWMHEGVPSDAAEFAGWVGRNCTVESAEKLLRMFFVPTKKDPLKSVNLRQEQERKKLLQSRKQKSEAGKRGMAKRWKQTSKSDNSVITKDNIPIPISIPISNKEKEGTNVPLSASADESGLVFEHWQKTLKHETAKLTKDRRAKIKARLAEGYTVDQLKRAIDGCGRSPHHMGVNDRGVRYDNIELIFRNGEKVEQFIGYCDPPKVVAPPSVRPVVNEAEFQKLLMSQQGNEYAN